MNTAILSNTDNFITSPQFDGYNSAMKGLGNETVVEQVNKKALDPIENRNNQNTLVRQVQNSTVGLNIHNPDLTKPSMVANPKMLEEQLARLGVVLSDVKPQERTPLFSEAAEDFVVEAKRAGFDITAINSSSAGKFVELLALVIKTALEARKSTADMANMGREVAHDTNRASTQMSIEAAEGKMTQAITSGVTSTAMAGAGGFRSGQGLNTQSTAVKTHGSDAMYFKSLKGKAESASNIRTPEMIKDPSTESDTGVLKGTLNDLENSQNTQTRLQQEMQIRGQQQQSQGQVTMATANGMGSIAGAPLYVDIAEDEATASNLNTDKDMYLSSFEASQRMADQEQKLKADLLQLMDQVAAARNNTISAMTSNLKG